MGIRWAIAFGSEAEVENKKLFFLSFIFLTSTK
jgi:hypothetical protein